MRIGLLTSSRADYGIYKPLINAFEKDDNFLLSIIAFGTHLSPFHGYSLQNIISDGHKVAFEVNSLLAGDNENSVATSCALTSLKFADFWESQKNNFDFVFCLGDRYEMFAAVSAGIPFGIKFAHLYGGETTLGAIDNTYRHMITLSSKIHFTSLDEYSQKVSEVLGSKNNTYTIGSLSLDNLQEVELLNLSEFNEKWGVDLNKPTVLVTVHPETVSPAANTIHLAELLETIKYLSEKYQVVITMPNADTFGSVFRKGYNELVSDNVKLIENFGTQSYFTCMKYAKFMIGNTSSGITEAASFHKFVINLGNRQKGRVTEDNVLHVPFAFKEIITAVQKIEKAGEYLGSNPYYQGGAVNKIIQILKSYKRG
jgi:GDP/UDP-N,N'-diacetylbacillosamine 2-epimerase (hydrolysing)